ncbi:hypothetical protein EMIT0P176_50024 [Pseudomonas sp. IT-P176]
MSITVDGVLTDALRLMPDDLTSTTHSGCVLALLVCVRNYHRRPRPAFFFIFLQPHQLVNC